MELLPQHNPQLFLQYSCRKKYSTAFSPHREVSVHSPWGCDASIDSSVHRMTHPDRALTGISAGAQSSCTTLSSCVHRLQQAALAAIEKGCRASHQHVHAKHVPLPLQLPPSLFDLFHHFCHLQRSSAAGKVNKAHNAAGTTSNAPRDCLEASYPGFIETCRSTIAPSIYLVSHTPNYGAEAMHNYLTSLILSLFFMHDPVMTASSCKSIWRWCSQKLWWSISNQTISRHTLWHSFWTFSWPLQCFMWCNSQKAAFSVATTSMFKRSLMRAPACTEVNHRSIFAGAAWSSGEHHRKARKVKSSRYM